MPVLNRYPLDAPKGTEGPIRLTGTTLYDDLGDVY